MTSLSFKFNTTVGRHFLYGVTVLATLWEFIPFSSSQG